MLKSGIYKKSLHLSAKSQTAFPAGTIINISTHDVAFFKNYFFKVHDLWSALLQIIMIFLLVLWIMGTTCLIGTVNPQ
jgi:ATP-binding cassette subfamily C (CFTR/MRP) protein 1